MLTIPRSTRGLPFSQGGFRPGLGFTRGTLTAPFFSRGVFISDPELDTPKRMKMTVGLRLVGFLLVGLILLAVSPEASATHEADHRFEVYGTVRDDKGQPQAKTKVIIVDSRINEGTTVFTGPDGEYKGTLHLHNSDLGDEITVAANGQRKTIRAEFDPEDTETARRVRVDFGAPAAPGTGNPGMGRNAAIGAAVLIALALFIAAKRRKKSSGPNWKKSGKKKEKS